MRKIHRNASPECLSTNAETWTAHYVAARQTNPSHEFKWRSKPCYQAIRQQLSAMTQQHCAFCDGIIGTQSQKTIEHFRPKSLFPELAYEWNNLFPCCNECQSHKSNGFSESLLKPDSEEYQFQAYFIVNYLSGELEPHPNAPDEDKLKAKVTIDHYGLNLPDRNTERKRELEHFNRDPNPYLDDYNYRYFLE